jgi:phosphopantothenoylcysteine decarboxylase / phosphopantothenate---cysteine ligase
MLREKTVVLGITGGIAAYKAAELTRLFVKAGATVHVIMTESATQFIGPLTFQTLTGNPVYVNQFDLIGESEIGHISLADRADVLLIAPATANVMGKVANGIADDLLTTTTMATKAPVVFAPAMNVNMWDSPAMQRNLKTLKKDGHRIVEPGEGFLACNWTGKGRLAELAHIVFAVEDACSVKPLAGKNIVVTAGPTREPVDPVRFWSNKSSGKMGFALARAAKLMGAKVTLIAGPTSAEPFDLADKFERVGNAEEMLRATKKAVKGADALLMCAAVADVAPANPLKRKAEKADLGDTTPMKWTPDVLKTVAKKKGKTIMVGFAAQTDDVEQRAKKKLKQKGIDFIAANDVSKPGVGMEAEENEVRIFGANGLDVTLAKKPKTELAFEIIRTVFEIDPE